MALRVPQYQQQVSTAPLPSVSAPTSVPSGTAALAAGVSSLGGAIADVAADNKAKDDQTAVFNGVALGRQQADTSLESWYSTNGPVAIETADRVVSDFDESSSKIRSTLTPDQQRGYDMQIESVRADVRTSVAKRKNALRLDVANKSLANVVQSYTNSAALKASHGAVRSTRYAPGFDDPTGDDWLKIKSAIEAHGATYSASLPVDQETWTREALAVARSDFHTAKIKALLTPRPDVPVDYQAARHYFAANKAEIDIEGADNRDAIGANVERAWAAGETTRYTEEIYAQNASRAEPWAAREKAMADDAGKVPEPYREGVLSALRTKAGQQQQAEAQVRRETFDSLKQAISQGVPIQRVVSSAEYGALSAEPELQDALIGHANNVALGTYVVTDPAEYDRLTKLAVDDPAAFANENLGANMSLSVADAKMLSDQQSGIVAGLKSGDTRASGFLTTETVVNTSAEALYPGDGDEAKGKRGRYKRELNEAVIAWQQTNGKQASPEQVQDIADAYTGKAIFSKPAFGMTDRFGRSRTFTYDTERTLSDEMPADVLDDAVAALSRAGLPVTTENLIGFWDRYRAGE